MSMAKTGMNKDDLFFVLDDSKITNQEIAKRLGLPPPPRFIFLKEEKVVAERLSGDMLSINPSCANLHEITLTFAYQVRWPEKMTTFILHNPKLVNGRIAKLLGLKIVFGHIFADHNNRYIASRTTKEWLSIDASRSDLREIVLTFADEMTYPK